MAADFEVFEVGGIAHLVEKTKAYADRSGGTGTTQLANGAVTTEKMGDSAVTGAKLGVPYFTWVADGSDQRLAVSYTE